MAYDAAHHQDVLYGGSLPGVRMYDTWKWTGSDWAQGAYGPFEARGWSQVVYDDSTQKVMAFVTHALPQPPSNYLLEWNGSNWKQLPLGGGPSARDGAAVAYDAATNEVVLFGGNVNGVATAETWTWSGGAWSRAG
jgi:hypothetical protein